MTEYQNFSSLPPELERHFVPFERHSVEAGKKAWMLAVVFSSILAVVMLLVVMSFEAPENKHADSMGGFNSEVEKEEAKAPAKAPAPAASEEAADEADEPDEADEADEEGAAGEGEAEETDGEAGDGSAEAPPPPKGATKAPPTSLVK